MTPPLRRVWCTTLGCDKNLVDSEALLGRFAARGLAATDDPARADVWVLNTCGFIAATRADSLEKLRELVAAKGRRRLVVTGCLAQMEGARLLESHPGIDVVAGVGNFDAVVAAVLDEGVPDGSAGPAERDEAAAARGVAARGVAARGRAAAGRRRARAARTVVGDPGAASYEGLAGRPLLTPPHVAFVKLSEGCDGACSFCRIPLIRGPQRSRDPDEIVAEAAELAARGVTELQLVAQDASSYGRDRGTRLGPLLERLDRIDGLRWIRLLYLYPGVLTLAETRRLLELERVVPYLDLPVQHAAPDVLRAMRRPADSEGLARYLLALRRDRPELVLRTTLLLGFPGETEDDVERLADFLARVEFDHLGAYRYSPEADTPAAALPGRVPDEEVADREARLLDLQAEIALRRQERHRLGAEFEAVIDAVVPRREAAALQAALAEGSWAEGGNRGEAGPVEDRSPTVALARTWHHGYDLDGTVLLAGPAGPPGARLPVRIAAVTPFDALGIPARAAVREKGGPA